MSCFSPSFVPALYYNMNWPVKVELDHLSCVSFFFPTQGLENDSAAFQYQATVSGLGDESAVEKMCFYSSAEMTDRKALTQQSSQIRIRRKQQIVNNQSTRRSSSHNIFSNFISLTVITYVCDSGRRALPENQLRLDKRQSDRSGKEQPKCVWGAINHNK